MWIQHPLVLESKSVRLEPLEEAHFMSLVEAAKDNRIWPYMPLDGTDEMGLRDSLEEALMLREKGEQYPFVIIHKEANKVIGATRYLKINETSRNLEVGWTWYVPECWGTGINEECKLQLFTYAFEELKTVRVQISAAEKNVRSRAAIEKVGARLEGVFRSFIIRYNGMRNVACYGIIDDEWPAVKVRLEQLIADRTMTVPVL